MEQDTSLSQPEYPLPHNNIGKQLAVVKILVFVLVGIVLLLIGLIIVLLSQRNPPITTVITPTPASTTMLTRTPSPLLSATPEMKTYTNADVGFSFSYPSTIDLNDESQISNKIVLFTNVDKLTDIPEDLPMSMGRIDALKEKERLSRGEGDELVKIGSLNGQIDTTFSQLEVCSVMFVRTVTFYPGEYRVILVLTAPKARVFAEMPEYFKVDQTNCGPEQVWHLDKVNEFEMKLKNKQGVGSAQEWYNAFEPIVNSIVVVPPGNSMSADWTTYKNDVNGFEISYPKPYRVLDDKDNLYGYPHGVALIYAGGQSYDIQIEVWDTKSEYETAYEGRLSDLTIVESHGKFITLLNNTLEPDNKKILASFKLLQ